MNIKRINTAFTIGNSKNSFRYSSFFLLLKGLLFSIFYAGILQSIYGFAPNTLTSEVYVTKGTIVSGKFEVPNSYVSATTIYVTSGTLVSNLKCFSNNIVFENKNPQTNGNSNSKTTNIKVGYHQRESSTTDRISYPIFPSPYTISDRTISQGTAPTPLYKYRSLLGIPSLVTLRFFIEINQNTTISEHFCDFTERLFFLLKEQPRPPPIQAL